MIKHKIGNTCTPHYAHPVGISNCCGYGHTDLNPFIQQNLGEKGYHVIRHIYNNLPWLHELGSSIPSLDYLQNNIHKLADIANNMDILTKLTGSLESVEYLSDNIDVILDFVPKMKEFNEGVEKINQAKEEIIASRALVQEELEKAKQCQTHLQDRLNQVQEIMDEVILRRDVIYKALSEIDDNSQAIAQLKATTATTDYNLYGEEAHRARAEDLIKKSEKYSNDETDNKGKYNFTRDNGGILDNMQELASEVNEEVQVVINDER